MLERAFGNALKQFDLEQYSLTYFVMHLKGENHQAFPRIQKWRPEIIKMTIVRWKRTFE